MISPHIDLIIRIKNGYLAEKADIDALYSKMNVTILDILKKQGYIESYEIHDDSKKQSISIVLKYDGKRPAVQDVKIHSKPGRREYAGKKEIKSVLGGLGIKIVSTSKGLMTDKEARDQKIGGEVICSIW